MAIKGMRQDRTGHIGSDTWKNDKQNEQRGSHEKGEQAVAAALADLAEEDPFREPDQPQGAAAPAAKPGKGAG
jgi:hypothetical protein